MRLLLEFSGDWLIDCGVSLLTRDQHMAVVIRAPADMAPAILVPQEVNDP